MTKSGSLKRYNSGIKNVHKRLNSTSEDGVNARAKYYHLTKNKIYLEKNFQKALEKGTGNKISNKQVRHDFKLIREQKKKVLTKEYDRLIKEGAPIKSKKEFIDSNLHDDLEWQDVRELFNSV